MLLSSVHELEPSPDDNVRSFAELRRSGAGGDAVLGGFKLAYQAASWRRWWSITALRLVEIPLWKRRGTSAKKVKSPQKGLVRLAQGLAGHLWLNEQRLKDLVNVLHQSEEFSRVKLYFDLSLRQLVVHEAERNLQLFVQSVYRYVVQLLGYRGRSLSKFNSPPDCYACLCLETADVTVREENKAKLTEGWKALRLLQLSPW